MPVWYICNAQHIAKALTCSADGCSTLLQEVAKPLVDGTASSTLEGWLKSFSAQTVPASQLRAHVTLLQSCNTALDLIKDVGFEVALQFLADNCLMNTQDKPGSGNAQQGTAQQVNTSSRVSQIDAARLSAELVTDLSKKVCHLQLALAAVGASISGASISFPKFKELVTLLADQQARTSASHIMVFVKERQSVHAIAAMLRKVPELAQISFFAYTGRAAAGSGSTSRFSGMKRTEQKNALHLFKEAKGTAVLVATAAAEEGLDISSCEMVVCYTVVQSGRERAQRRGRARKACSLFVNIIEPQDQGKLADARLAESNACIAQLRLSEISL